MSGEAWALLAILLVIGVWSVISHNYGLLEQSFITRWLDRIGAVVVWVIIIIALISFLTWVADQQ